MLYEITLLYMKTRNTYNSCSTFLKPTKLDIQSLYGLFKLLRGFGKFGDQPNFVKSCFYNSFSTFLKPTKLDVQCFYGLFKLLGGFGKIGDQPNFLKTCFDTWKLVIPTTLVLHSSN